MRYISKIKCSLVIVVLFLFTTGLLGFCEKNISPCALKIDYIVNGIVIPSDTGQIVIKGSISKGSDGIIPILPVSLKANGNNVAFDKVSGKFEYKITPDPKLLYYSIMFEMKDIKSNITTQRIVFAYGNSAEPGAKSVVESAYQAKIVLPATAFEAYKSQRWHQLGIEASTLGNVSSYVNTWKKDKVYGYKNKYYGSKNEGSPYKTCLLPANLKQSEQIIYIFPPEADLNYAGRGVFNLGKVSISCDPSIKSLDANGELPVTIRIDPEDWVNPGQNDGFFFNCGGRVEGTNVGIWISSDSVVITNVILKFKFNESNQLVAEINTSKVDAKNNIAFSGNPQRRCKDLNGKSHSIPDYAWKYLQDWFIREKLKEILSMSNITANTLNVEQAIKDLGAPYVEDFVPLTANKDMLTENWDTNEAEFGLNETQYSIDLDMGISAKASSNAPNVVPALSKFFYTPLEDIDLKTSGDENLVIALNDEIINNIMFVDMQVGHLKDMYPSDDFMNALQKLGLGDMMVRITLDVPPITDFRTPAADDPNDPKSSGKGMLLVRDMRAEFINKSNKTVGTASIDLDVLLDFSADSQKFLHARISGEKAKFSAVFLLDKLGKPAIMADLKNELCMEAFKIINQSVEDNLDFNFPALSIFSANPKVEIKGFSLAGNAQILRLLVK